MTDNRHAALITAGWEHYTDSTGGDLYIQPGTGEVYTIDVAWYIETLGGEWEYSDKSDKCTGCKPLKPRGYNA